MNLRLQAYCFNITARKSIIGKEHKQLCLKMFFYVVYVNVILPKKTHVV